MRVEPDVQFALWHHTHREVTGGLDDSVTDVSDDPDIADGIKFTEYSPRALVKAIRKALVLYEDKELLAHFRRNAMTVDFSWEHCTHEYEAAFERALEATLFPDGGVVSRAPIDQLELLELLLFVQAVYEARQLRPADFVAAAITRLVPGLKGATLGDGLLAALHGGSLGTAQRIERVRAGADRGLHEQRGDQERGVLPTAAGTGERPAGREVRLQRAEHDRHERERRPPDLEAGDRLFSHAVDRSLTGNLGKRVADNFSVTLVIFVFADTDAYNDLLEFWYLMYVFEFQFGLQFFDKLVFVQSFQARSSGSSGSFSHYLISLFLAWRARRTLAPSAFFT